MITTSSDGDSHKRREAVSTSAAHTFAGTIVPGAEFESGCPRMMRTQTQAALLLLDRAFCNSRVWKGPQPETKLFSSNFFSPRLKRGKRDQGLVWQATHFPIFFTEVRRWTCVSCRTSSGEKWSVSGEDKVDTEGSEAAPHAHNGFWSFIMEDVSIAVYTASPFVAQVADGFVMEGGHLVISDRDRTLEMLETSRFECSARARPAFYCKLRAHGDMMIELLD